MSIPHLHSPLIIWEACRRQRQWVRRALADIHLADRIHRPQLRQQLVAQRMQPRPRSAAHELLVLAKPIVSAFDDNEGYDLTELGKQFMHYAMTELSPKIEFSDETPQQEK